MEPLKLPPANYTLVMELAARTGGGLQAPDLEPYERRGRYDGSHTDGTFIGSFDETPLATASARHIQVVLNWFQELNARVPAK